MEYMGMAGLWKKFEGFAVTEPESTIFIALGVAVALILVFKWLAKK